MKIVSTNSLEHFLFNTLSGLLSLSFSGKRVVVQDILQLRFSLFLSLFLPTTTCGCMSEDWVMHYSIHSCFYFLCVSMDSPSSNSNVIGFRIQFHKILWISIPLFTVLFLSFALNKFRSDFTPLLPFRRKSGPLRFSRDRLIHKHQHLSIVAVSLSCFPALLCFRIVCQRILLRE